ncbi:MAG TPA: helix-turn-helix domain-containing protein [Thermaerobacter sp.]
MDPVKVCPRYEQAVQILGKKWTGLILRVLMTGKKRFCDFKASLPEMSDRILSERLKELEEAGILTRHVHDTRPVLIEYELTEKGRALEPVVAAIQAWADRWCDGIPDSHAGGEGTAPDSTDSATRDGHAAGKAVSPS